MTGSRTELALVHYNRVLIPRTSDNLIVSLLELEINSYRVLLDLVVDSCNICCLKQVKKNYFS